jgi:ArsR family transcriptional regulator
MEASDIYKCITDLQRLRILNLLEAGPLCVCHLQEILEASQVKISKQLASIKQLGLVHATREGTWMIYHLNQPPPELLIANLDHLRRARSKECTLLQEDLKARTTLVELLSNQSADCPKPVCESIGCCT